MVKNSQKSERHEEIHKIAENTLESKRLYWYEKEPTYSGRRLDNIYSMDIIDEMKNILELETSKAIKSGDFSKLGSYLSNNITVSVNSYKENFVDTPWNGAELADLTDSHKEQMYNQLYNEMKEEFLQGHYCTEVDHEFSFDTSTGYHYNVNDLFRVTLSLNFEKEKIVSDVITKDGKKYVALKAVKSFGEYISSPECELAEDGVKGVTKALSEALDTEFVMMTHLYQQGKISAKEFEKYESENSSAKKYILENAEDIWKDKADERKKYAEAKIEKAKEKAERKEKSLPMRIGRAIKAGISSLKNKDSEEEER